MALNGGGGPRNAFEFQIFEAVARVGPGIFAKLFADLKIVAADEDMVILSDHFPVQHNQRDPGLLDGRYRGHQGLGLARTHHDQINPA